MHFQCIWDDHLRKSKANEKHCFAINMIYEADYCGEGGVGHVFVCQVIKSLWLCANHLLHYHHPSVSYRCVSEASVSRLRGQRGKIVFQEVTYPTARLNQINSDKFKHLKWCPCLLRGDFRAVSWSMMLFWGTTHSSFARRNTSHPPPSSLLVFMSTGYCCPACTRLSPGLTCCLGPKFNIINNREEEMGESNGMLS